MQADQTAAEPPKKGRIRRPINGWTENSRKALQNTVAQCSSTSLGDPEISLTA
jgi:hypothetical protein